MSAVEGGTGGYTVGPSGIRRQWGQVVVGGNSSATVTFPVAFASLHTIQTMPNGASGAVSIYPWISAASTSSFTLQNGSANGINFLWSAEGAA
jgi:hypothetical protein